MLKFNELHHTLDHTSRSTSYVRIASSRYGVESKALLSSATVSVVRLLARLTHACPRRRHAWPMDGTHPSGVRRAAREGRKEGEGEPLAELTHAVR